MSDDSLTDFGFRSVPVTEKAGRVRRVFESVATRYDLMNDLMSLGVHRLWKRAAINRMRLRAGHSVLDLASGTGDLATMALDRVGAAGEVVMSDVNSAMLGVGRDRMIDAGYLSNLHVVQADAERLPFPESSFDAVSIAFGLRNVTDKGRALSEMRRVVRPGGRVVVLEFSKVVVPLLERLYDLYSFEVIPRLGGVVTGDRDSYRYLVESIRRHPDQQTLRCMFADAGLERCGYDNLSAGVVAIHYGDRL